MTPKLIDPLGGQEDLLAGLIKVADEQAIADDSLRALRAIRLAAEFGFTMTAQTQALVQAGGAGLNKVSSERLRDEVLKLLQVPQPSQAINLLLSLNLLDKVLPEVLPMQGVAQSPPHHLPVFEHSLLVMDNWARTNFKQDTFNFLDPIRADLATYFETELAGNLSRATLMPVAALFHDIGKPQTAKQGEDGRIRFWQHPQVGAEIANDVLERWRMSSQSTRFICDIVTYHMRPLFLGTDGRLSKRAIHRFLADTGDSAPAIAIFSLFDHLSIYQTGAGQAEWLRLTEVVLALCQAYFAPKLPILLTGREVMKTLKISPGPQIGVILKDVREAQAMGEINTTEEAVAFVKEKYGNVT